MREHRRLVLTGLPAGDGLVVQGLMGLFWLGVVLLLVLGAARLARRLPALRVPAQPAGELVLRGSLALDSRRRLHVVDVAGRQALVLTGGGNDVLLGLPPAG